MIEETEDVNVKFDTFISATVMYELSKYLKKIRLMHSICIEVHVYLYRQHEVLISVIISTRLFETFYFKFAVH